MASVGKYPSGTVVTVPYLVGQSLNVESQGALLRFYGHDDPVPVSSVHKPQTVWSCEAKYPTKDYSAAEALINLFATAAGMADRRLLLTPGVAEGTSGSWTLNQPTVVAVFAWDVPREAAMVTVSFTATRVSAA